MKRAGAALLAAWLLLSAVQAVAAHDDATERARISAERAAVEARFVERERACASRFVVTACVEDARREQRAALALLRQQQTVLDETQRKQRAAERLDKLAKPRASTPHAPAAARDSREAGARHLPVDASPAASAPPHTPAQPAARPHKEAVTIDRTERQDQRQTQEAAHQADFAARQQAAQAHRTAAEQRLAERSKKGRAARPLPAPASAAAP